MKPPTIHLNGSGRERLLGGATTAIQAVDAAIDAVAAMRPHGRDYYPQGPAALLGAQADHDRMLAALQDVLGELTRFAYALADEPGGKR